MAEFIEILSQYWLLISVGTLFVLGFFRAIYRLYFSPLAKFPGPKLAAATRLYEIYYDLIKQGRYTFEIEKMHQKYGPIVRISPYELHINDPDYYQELYSRSSPRNKWVYYTRQFANPESTFSTVDHLHHRLRRGAMNPFFSKQKILKLEGMMTYLIEKLCLRFEEYKRSGQPLPLRLAMMCLTTDVITKYAMALSWDHLDTPDFSPVWVETVKAAAGVGVAFKHVPWMFDVLNMIPDKVLAAINPGMVLILDFQRTIESHIKRIMRDIESGNDDKEKYRVDGQPTIFHELLNSDLPPEEKSLQRLWQEGQLVVGAGADTTANSLTVTLFHLLDNPDKMEKLKNELQTVMPHATSVPKLQELEKLPYLTAVLNEGLRMSYGVSTRTQRIAPNETLRFHEWTIPPGTPVGMTSVLMHHNESIFPNSHSFVPERWLDPEKPHLDRYLVTFSKGSRQCIGMVLAKAEMYLTIAALVHRFDMQLFETTREDVDIYHDLFLPQPKTSKGVRVLVH